MTHPKASVSPSAPTRAPIVGVVAGVLFAAGLAAWTFQRVGEAKTSLGEVEARRAAEAERAASLAREPMRVATVVGLPERWRPRIELDGTLEARRETALGFEVGGRLARIGVEVGDEVQKGTVLAQLDDSEATAQLAAIGAQVRAAEASLELARDGERRTLPLVKSGSVPEATGVQSTRQRELAEAQLDANRAQLALARTTAQQHKLAAPFAGTVTQAPTGIGSVVAPGQTLFELVDTSRLKLATTVSEADASLLTEGSEVHLTSERGELVGRVTAVLSRLDPATRRVPVVAEFDNSAPAGPRLRAGAFVRAWVAAPDSIPVLRLPHDVLRPGSRDELFVLPAGAQQLELRRVVFATAADGALLVRQGVAPGERVVLHPTPEAKSGDTVRSRPAEPANGAAPEGSPAPAADVARADEAGAP